MPETQPDNKGNLVKKRIYRRKPCPHCGKVYSRLADHIRRTHLNQQPARPHKCKFCYKTFATLQERATHISSSHKKQSWSCSLCAKKLTTKRSWAFHESIICKVPDKGWGPQRLKREFNITLAPCKVAGCRRIFEHPSKLKKLELNSMI